MKNSRRTHRRPIRNNRPLRPRAYVPAKCGLYAILLDDTVVNDPKYRAANPGYVPGMPHFYIGASNQPPAKRFCQHKDGRFNSSRIAYQYGICLCEAILPKLKPMARKRAYEQERRLARRLRAAGNGVWQA